MSSYTHFYKQLDTTARRVFPGLKELGGMQWEYLISPLELRLPRSVLDRAQAAVSALYTVSRRPDYQSQLEDTAGLAALPVKNRSVLMAYDFHTNEQGECFLVEINTNASGYLLSALMQMAHQGAGDPDTWPALRDLQASFAEEARLSGVGTAPHVLITDDDIPAQKMYVEFLMYRDWFERIGWSARFCEGKDFAPPAALVYNRLTDFYLEDPAHKALRAAYVRGEICLTPQPKEYWLLADKQRLVQFTQPDFLDRAGASEQDKAAIRRVLIPTFEKSAWATEDALWAERRHLFFKPKRSYGGKSVYRGESVSRKVFERLMQEDILIQRFQPAQRVPTDDPRSVLNNWKFDLRCFAYAGRIQMAVARIYQGQVTNFSSPMGGFTLVQFVGVDLG